jgi:glycine cleavage system regulatory protein
MGAELFNAKAILNIPPTLALDHLKQELEKLADDMIVDIAIS